MAPQGIMPGENMSDFFYLGEGIEEQQPAQESSLPKPTGFEGAEKRLEVDFVPREGALGDKGLRSLSRAQVDAFLAEARCTVVSTLSNEYCDSYVLSESSLFLYPYKAVVKTCGQTALLASLPHLLRVALDSAGLVAKRVRYSRTDYLWPEEQPEEHHTFDNEVAFLRSMFPKGVAQTLGGDSAGAKRWYVFNAHLHPEGVDTAASSILASVQPAEQLLEVCVHGLDERKSRIYFKGDLDAAGVTKASGIRDLIPKAQIDDVNFDPCGYSMNALEGKAMSTIHITPEAGFSYASFEYSKPLDGEALHAIVHKVSGIFRGASISVVLTAGPRSLAAQAGHLSGLNIEGYGLVGSHACATFQDGAKVTFLHFKADEGKVSRPAAAGQASLVLTENVQLWKRVELRSGVSVRGSDSTVRFGGRFPPAKLLAYARHVSSRVVREYNPADAFYVADMAVIKEQVNKWRRVLPSVEPFYAIKCCPDPVMVSLLAEMGCGFDCASRMEFDQVIGLGVSADRIIFANPCKSPMHLSAAARSGVNTMTFDCVEEVDKIAELHPSAELVLRIATDVDSGARCRLTTKYGARANHWAPCFERALARGLKVVGISFHVGSGGANALSFAKAIASARKAFDMGVGYGFNLNLLDIGGGFPGDPDHEDDGDQGPTSFGVIGTSVREALDTCFPAGSGVRVIGEPGRFFAEAAYTLCATVLMRKGHIAGIDAEEDHGFQYYINDGVYGSLNSLVYDHATVEGHALEAWKDDLPRHRTTVFGPTCDGLDQIFEGQALPEFHIGDRMLFPRCGAYTMAAGSCFNGFDSALIKTHYFTSDVVVTGDEGSFQGCTLPLIPVEREVDVGESDCSSVDMCSSSFSDSSESSGPFVEDAYNSFPYEMESTPVMAL